MAHAPTPVVFRWDVLFEALLFADLRASFGLHGSHLAPSTRFGKVSTWWWGTELGLGHGWGKHAELSVWAVASFDALSVRGDNTFDGRSSHATRPLISTSARLKARTMLGSAWMLGAAVDAGWFVQGAHFTALGDPLLAVSGLRAGARVLLGYAF